MKYHFKIHKEKGNGYWAECLELEGCRTEGDTLKELRKNMKEALELFLSEPEDSRMVFPLPRTSFKNGRNVVAVAVEPKLALAVILKRLRLENKFTQQQLANKLAMNRVYSYQRLESGDANPELQTLVMLKKVYGEDLSLDSIFDVE